jgi:hypothetical protein
VTNRSIFIHRALDIVAATAAILVVGCFAFGKYTKISLEDYLSDMFVNTEVSRNIWEFGDILFSSVFGNMAAVHLYFWSFLDSPFLSIFGSRFYAIVPVLSGASFIFFIHKLNDFYGRKLHGWQMSLLFLFFYANPLFWNTIDQPVYGFQHDQYIYVILPFLILYTETRAKMAFWVSLALTLFVKEEAALVLMCIGGSYVLQKNYRRRGL